MSILVELDGRRLGDSADSLEAALGLVRTACPQGRVVVEVEGDGRPIEPAVLNDPTRAGSYSTVKVRTGDAGQLVRDSLLQAADMVREQGPRHTQTAELIHTARMHEAITELGELMGGWEQAKRVVDLATALTPRATEVTSCGGAVGVGLWLDDAAAELSVRLNDIKSALASDDWSALADVLGGDMPGLSERWATLLGEMAIYSTDGPEARGPSGVATVAAQER